MGEGSVRADEEDASSMWDEDGGSDPGRTLPSVLPHSGTSESKVRWGKGRSSSGLAGSRSQRGRTPAKGLQSPLSFLISSNRIISNVPTNILELGKEVQAYSSIG